MYYVHGQPLRRRTIETYSTIEEVIERNLIPLIGKDYIYLYDLASLGREVSVYDKTTQKYVVDTELLQDYLEAGTYEKKYLDIPAHMRGSTLDNHIYDTEALLNNYGLTQEHYDRKIENQRCSAIPPKRPSASR